MKLAKIPFKLLDPTQMTPDYIREYVIKQITGYNSLLEIGCGSGAIALDFLLNGGKYVSLIDKSKYACRIAKDNIEHNCFQHIPVFNGGIIEYTKIDIAKYDCIVVSTAWVHLDELEVMLSSYLRPNGLLLVILREDVINSTSLAVLKEVVSKCKVKQIEALIDPIDLRMRLVYQVYNLIN